MISYFIITHFTYSESNPESNLYLHRHYQVRVGETCLQNLSTCDYFLKINLINL